MFAREPFEAYVRSVFPQMPGLSAEEYEQSLAAVSGGLWEEETRQNTLDVLQKVDWHAAQSMADVFNIGLPASEQFGLDPGDLGEAGGFSFAPYYLSEYDQRKGRGGELLLPGMPEGLLPWQGFAHPANWRQTSYNRRVDEGGYLGTGQWRGHGLSAEAAARLEEIQQGYGSPDDPYTTNLGLSGKELAPDISFRVEEGRIRSVLTRALNLNRILSQMGQTTRGQYQNEIAARAKQFVIENYKGRQRNALNSTSGTLGAALQEIQPKVSIDPRTGMAIDLELPDRTRPARENEPEGVSVRKYGPIVFQGRPGIESRNQRFLRFKYLGRWLTTKNVQAAPARPVNPMHYPKQREELAQMFGQMVYQGLKEHIGAAVESEQRNEGLGLVERK